MLNIWGPVLWYIINSITFNYNIRPNDLDKEHYLLFFNSLKNIIPCNICQKHYSDFLNSNPLEAYLESRDKLIEWVLKCHNNVNSLSNKKIFTIGEINDLSKTELYTNEKTFVILFFFIFQITGFVYPKKASNIDIEKYTIFFTNLKNIIPYLKFKQHYVDFFEREPIKSYLKDGNLSGWLLKFNNLIHKKYNIISHTKGNLIQFHLNIYQKMDGNNNFDYNIIINMNNSNNVTIFKTNKKLKNKSLKGNHKYLFSIFLVILIIFVTK
jgi:hypothetical protein